ncbi:MAG: transporter substrate-binding domain-containing protein [bacterium]|nr:transporter substrate-binding domain-containing protein [bacterium]
MKKLVALLIAVMLLCSAALADALVMATNASFPPYEFIDDNGGYAGIDVEIATAIAAKLGYELDVLDIEFGAIISAVNSGKADFSMAGMTVTEERKQSVNFSHTYATGVQVAIVKADCELTLDDLLAADAKYLCGVQESTTGDIYISGDLGDDRVLRYPNGNEAVMALKAGKIDFVIIDNEPAKNYVAVNEGLKILETEYVIEDYAACFAKENTELLDKFNAALQELIDDGTIAAIVAKYIPAE